MDRRENIVTRTISFLTIVVILSGIGAIVGYVAAEPVYVKASKEDFTVKYPIIAERERLKCNLRQANIEANKKAEEERIRLEEEATRLEAERLAQEQAIAEQQAYVEETYAEPTYCNGSGLNPSSGVNYHNGWRETYYSSNVLYHYRTPEWTVDANGVYRDADGYVIVASSSDAQGSIVDTSFGAGKVYDTGCAEGTHDIYVNW